MPKINRIMKRLIMTLVLEVLNVSAAPAPFSIQLFMYQPMLDNQMQLPMDQPVMNPIMMNQIMEQQMMEQMMQQHQYQALQQQLIALQQFQRSSLNTINRPMLLKLPPQSTIMLFPMTMTKTGNRLDKPNESDHDQPNFKLTDGNSDSVVIDAEENESNIPMIEAIPRRAILVLPNGQRLFIGSIISAIPFLPFEVNVPDTIAWMYNGIAGIIGGIGQRLPFRPKPTSTTTTESPDVMQTGGSMTATPVVEESRLKWLQKLTTRKQNVGMPILMLPVAQPVPIQLPIQV